MAYMKKRFIGTNIRSVQDVITNAPHTGIVILFLDFRKAFDSMNHLFLFTLLTHIGLPAKYIIRINILYHQSESVVQYKNWLSVPFVLGCGVCQGCDLLCHLFNLVRQVLIFSLRDCGYFEWWTFL